MQFQQQFTAVQVKQESPNHNQMTNANAMTADIKYPIVDQSQNQIQQMHIIEGPPISPHHVSNNSNIGNHTTTISTMSPLQAIQTDPNEWGGTGRLQLLQPSLSNQAYLQHLAYPPVLMPGNIIHAGLSQQPIQIITAGKPITGNTSQMITTQNKPMLGGNTANLSGSYTIPGIPSSQSQALVFSPVNVIGSQQQQQNILSNISGQANTNKTTQQDLQKSIQNQKVVQKLNTSTISNVQNINANQNTNIQTSQQCVQVSQAMPTAQVINSLPQQTTQQSMQIPWSVQNVPFWTSGIQPQTLIPNQIIIRGTQPDGSPGMFLQPAAPNQTIQTQQTNHQNITMSCTVPQATTQLRPQIDSLNSKPRAPLILPQNAISNKPASNVSTQTAQNQNLLTQKSLKKTKQHIVRPALSTIKPDVTSHLKATVQQQNMQQQSMQQVVTSMGNKMVVVSTGGPVLQSGINTQNNFNTTDKSQQIQQHIKQQAIMQQQQLILQQNSNQQIQLQQPISGNQFSSQPQIQTQQASIQSNPNTYVTQSPQQIQSNICIQSQHQQQQREIQFQQQQQQQHQQQQQQSANILNQIFVAAQQQQSAQNSANKILSNLEKQICINTPHSNANTNIPIAISSSVSITPQTNFITSLPTNSITSSVTTTPVVTVASISNVQVSDAISTHDQQSSLKANNIKYSDLNEISEISGNQTVESITESKKSNEAVSEVSEETMKLVKENKNEENKILANSNKENLEENIENKCITLDVVSHSNEPPAIKHNLDENLLKPSLNLKGLPKSDRELPKAMIKPNVLTHVIEGFVIQEGKEPFSVARTRYSERDAVEEPPSKKMNFDENLTNDSKSHIDDECSTCGSTKKCICISSNTTIISDGKIQSNFEYSNTDLDEKCYNDEKNNKDDLIKSNNTITIGESSKPLDTSDITINNNTANNNNNNNNNSNNSNNNTNNSSNINSNNNNNNNNNSSSNNNNNNTNNNNNSSNNNNSTSNQDESPLKRWTISDVCDFIKNLPGFGDYAEEFANQEIDGPALLLLNENHLVNTMGMKLGPALKIVAKIESIKDGQNEKEN